MTELIDRPPLESDLSPERAKLALRIQRLAAAAAALERAQQPLGLAGIAARSRAAEAADLRAELERLREGDKAAVDAWMRSGAEEPRPLPSAETLAAEKGYAEIAAELGEAERDLPLQVKTVAEAAAAARAAIAERDAAVYAAAVEAALPLLEHMDAAAAEAHWLHATLQGLFAELTRRGQQPNHAPAFAAAEQLANKIRAVKQRRAPPVDVAAAARLLDLLATDARAVLLPSTAR